MVLGQVDYYTRSAKLPLGKYKTDSIHLVGGTITADSKITPAGEPPTLELTPFSEFESVKITLTNAKLVARNVTFFNCQITAKEGSQVDLNGCILDGTIMTQSFVPAKLSSEGPLVPVEDRLPSKIMLNDCVLNTTQLGYDTGIGDGNIIGATFHLNRCSIYGPHSKLPPYVLGYRFLERVKHDQITIKASKFLSCDLAPAAVVLSSDCVYEGCRLLGSEPVRIPGVTTMGVNATFLSKQPTHLSAFQFPQIRFSPVAPDTPVGSSLAHTLTDTGVKLANSGGTIPLQPMHLKSLLPPVNPVPLSPPDAPSGMLEVPKNPSGDVTGTEGSPDSGLKVKQSSVHGLLIMSLAGGEAGSASKMSAIALASEPTSNSMVRFNQPVGEMMTKALAEVAKFTQLNHGGWPKGHVIEISFADKYSDKDGPSAAVACSLLLHSLISGQELDPAFAVTGDMNADGSVQPIGGVAAKIRGATKGHCKLIGIPSKNESSLGDLLLTDGPAPFASIQVFGIDKFSDAEALALTVKPENTTLSIMEMNKVQEVLMRNPAQMGAWLKNQHVVAKLQQVLKDTPNHLSAKYLLMYASGKLPQTLSLAGSLSAIDNTAGDLLGAIKADKGDSFDSIGKSSVGSTLTRLQSLRARCDPRTRPYADAIISFGAAVKEAMDRPAQTGPRAMEYRRKILGAASSVESELSRLLNDPAVREELEN